MTAHPAERAGLLGTPLRVGRAVLRNRIVSPPMERNYCTVDGAPTPRYLAYLRARAAGGAALLFTGATPSWSSGWPTGPLLELEAPGAAGGDVAELARRHIATLDEYGVTGGYRLAGWAFGGVVAMEMAGQLERRGDPVDLVMLYGCAAPTGTVPVGRSAAGWS